MNNLVIIPVFECPRCGEETSKSYFAGIPRCWECNYLIDLSRIREKIFTVFNIKRVKKKLKKKINPVVPLRSKSSVYKSNQALHTYRGAK